MAQPELLPRLDAVADRYDVVFCDLWGVVHNGREAFKPAIAALQRFRAAGGAVVLVSNVPKPRDPIPGQLDRLGVPRDAWDAIATSGDAIRVELAARAPGPMVRIGPPEFDAALWAGLDLTMTEDLDAARFIGVSGLDEDAQSPEDYASLLQAAKLRDLELLCANPDIVVRVGDTLVWCAGAIARDYAALGGRVVMAGKPYPPIYALARQEAARVRGGAVDDARILAIGDGLGTDILGANREGLDALFIAAGLHGAAFFPGGRFDPAAAAAAMQTEGVRARYLAPELA